MLTVANLRRAIRLLEEAGAITQEAGGIRQAADWCHRNGGHILTDRLVCERCHLSAAALTEAGMTDFLPDTPALARFVCPGCEPSADPTAEILSLRWCHLHQPSERGVDDDVVSTVATWITGSNEAGGDDNRRWCQLIHHGSTAA